MTPEDITEIITRRMHNVVIELGLVGYDYSNDCNNAVYHKLTARLNELTETLVEIRALKENETK